jgi:hypothetical protein
MVVLPQGPGITFVVFSAVFMPLSIIAIILRLISRRINQKALELNDYFAIVACVMAPHPILSIRSKRV